MVPHVSASAEIPAAAADVYHLIADYREGHPRLLPTRADRSRVTIATALRVRPGFLGRLELSLMTRYLRRVYAAELALIDREARLLGR